MNYKTMVARPTTYSFASVYDDRSYLCRSSCSRRLPRIVRFCSQRLHQFEERIAYMRMTLLTAAHNPKRPFITKSFNRHSDQLTARQFFLYAHQWRECQSKPHCNEFL